MSKRGVRVSLNGGLGNQLFQYYAGLFVAKKSSQPLYLDMLKVEHGRTSHTVAIDALTVEATLLYSKHRYSISYLRQLLRDLIDTHVKSKSLNRASFSLGKQKSKTFTSLSLGYDCNLDAIEGPLRLEGYFQTWRYYSAITGDIFNHHNQLKLKEPSIQFLEKFESIRANRTLALHVRRGDYTTIKDSFGLLSVDYYKEGISNLKEKGFSWDQVWLFTDDVIGISLEFSDLIKADKIYVIQDGELTNPAEVMMLMSSASACVIANSTFSWWAATLGENKKAVVCPSKWFKSSEDPLDLYPSEWIRVKSTWV